MKYELAGECSSLCHPLEPCMLTESGTCPHINTIKPMPNLNKVMLIGNLTRDPELKFTPKGTAVAEMGLAINRVWKDEQGQKQEETTFVDVTLWGRTAELAGEYLSKGSSCYVEGRLTLDTWDDKQTGQKRSKLKVVGEALQFLGGRDSAGNPPQRQQRQQSAGPRTGYQNGTPPPRDNGGSQPDEMDDVPFAKPTINWP